ncbi:MAG TPA: flagellar export chaperone FliS [Phycisphaerae bacterium]|nr:flagellar export chaperone FliS [Phycisphaerae bacterium]
MDHRIAAYQETAVSTQTRGRLVVLLYEGAIKFLKLAQRQIEAGNLGAKGQYINKALAILDELDASLNLDAGGEVAQNLRTLYHFMQRHLGQANIHSDPHRIQDVLDCLEDLAEGWRAVTR